MAKAEAIRTITLKHLHCLHSQSVSKSKQRVIHRTSRLESRNIRITGAAVFHVSCSAHSSQWIHRSLSCRHHRKRRSTLRAPIYTSRRHGRRAQLERRRFAALGAVRELTASSSARQLNVGTQISPACSGRLAHSILGRTKTSQVTLPHFLFAQRSIASCSLTLQVHVACHRLDSTVQSGFQVTLLHSTKSHAFTNWRAERGYMCGTGLQL